MKAKTRKKRKIKKRLNKIKARGCVFCPEKDIQSLTFHHLIPSEKCMNISDMVYRRYSWEKIEEELEKCVVVCKKCVKGLHEPNNPVKIECVIEPVFV